MRRRNLLFSLVCGCLLVSTPIFAVDEIYVSKSSGNDSNSGSSSAPLQSIYAAVLKVKKNTETVIYLEENATFIGSQIDFATDKNVTLIGKNTTLKAAEKPGNEGGQGTRILRGGENTDLKIKGLNLVNGRQVEYVLGGGIYFAGKTLEVDSCRFIDNEAGSAGAGIASRGKNVIVKNSYFEGNYLIGGGSRGAAIMHAGLANGEPGCSLIVENSTFVENKMPAGGNGIAIAVYDASTAGGKYSNLDYLKVVNSTFVNNTSNYAYQAAIDISDHDVETYLINNTFYNNDGALRLFFNTKPIGLVNNVVYANKAAILSDLTASEGRIELTAYNNVFVGTERGVNEGMDEASLNADKAAFSNIVETLANYPIANSGLSTTFSTDGSFVPYLAITSATGSLVNAGLDDSSLALGVNLVPSTDVRGKGNDGRKDIGAFEFNGTSSGISSSNVDDQKLFTLSQNQSAITITNLSATDLTIKIVGVDGKLLKTATVANELTLDKASLNKGVLLFFASNGASSQVEKAAIY